MSNWTPLAKEYDPLKCGSIDGTDHQVHDKAILRAIQAKYKSNKGVKGDPHMTLFVGRLNHSTTCETLQQVFSAFDELKNITLVRDIVTGFSRGYAFIEFKNLENLNRAWREANGLIIDDSCIIADFEHERLMKGWVPRRLGGGFGGKKESGQLRFGCRERPFRKPINLQSSNNDDHRDKRPSSEYRSIYSRDQRKSCKSRSPDHKRRQFDHHYGKVRSYSSNRKDHRHSDSRDRSFLRNRT